MQADVSTDHDSLVARLAELLHREGHADVRADLTGAIRPERVTVAGTGQWCVPDATARGEGGLLLFEVETAGSIDGERTAARWPVLARHARETGAAFWIAVPAGCRPAAELRLRELSVDGQVLEL